MSVDNSELLMLLGGKKSKSTIGIAGQQGFGVGVYGGSPADLTAMGLAPMEGCENPSSDNYGNYIHTNGSIMCCIPAFCYRLGNATAPSYSRDGENALEIRDATEFSQFSHDVAFSSPDFGDGWILHRAFVDGNKLKNAFFIDKYLCSNVNGQAASVKNADFLVCFYRSGVTNPSYFTGSLGENWYGQTVEAISICRNRSDYHSLVTCFQWAAISLLSLAHGQAATSNQFCGWYDANHTTNFPKGATSERCKDSNDNSITYTPHSYSNTYAKTGSGTPFSKTTHNGQASGVADVAGMCNQIVIGAGTPNSSFVYLLNTPTAAHEITASNVNDKTLYSSYINGIHFSSGYGSSYEAYFEGIRNGTSGLDWAGAGFVPKSSAKSALFGNNLYLQYNYDAMKMLVGLGRYWGESAGVFCRSKLATGQYSVSGEGWDSSGSSQGFRAAAYPP